MRHEPENPRVDTADAGERLEAYLDGELSPSEEEAMAGELERSARLRREFERAREVRAALRALPEMDASPITLRRVLNQAREKAGTDRKVATPRRRRLAVALAATLAVAALGLSIWRSLEAPPEPDATEVARAVEEARWVLARVDRLTRKAGATMRDDVLTKYIVAPTRRGVETSLGLGPASDHRNDPLTPPSPGPAVGGEQQDDA